MGQVNTVRGPIDAEALGRTLMHEHVFVRSPEVAANWPTGLGPRRPVAQAVERLHELQGRRHRHHRRPHRGRASVATSSSSRRWPTRSSSTSWWPPASTPTTTSRTTSTTAARSSGRAGVDMLDEFFLHDIENGIAGSGVRPGHPEVRHRQAGAHARRRARAACRGPRPPPDGPSHLHPHRRPHPARPRPAAGLRRGGCGPGARRHRPQRRHHRPRLSRRAAAGRIHARHGPLRRRRLLPHREAGRDRRPAVRRRVGDAAWSSPTTPAATWTGSTTTSSHQAQPNWNFLHISRDVLPALAARGVSDEQIDTMLVDNRVASDTDPSTTQRRTDPSTPTPRGAAPRRADPSVRSTRRSPPTVGSRRGST